MDAYIAQFKSLPVSHQGLTMTGAFTVLWTVMFFALHPIQKILCRPYAKLKWNQQVEWNSRVVSTIHAIAAVAASLYTIWFDETFTNPPSGNLAFASSFPGVLAAALTLSYWIYDLATTLFFWSFLGDKLMLIHHLVGIFPFTLGMYRSELIMYASMIILTEISTPFVNNRWFFATLGWGSSKMYVLNGLAMWASFFCARILWVPYMLVDFWSNRVAVQQTLKLVWVPTIFGTIVTLILSSWWFYLITKGMLKAVGLIGGSGADKKKKAN